MGNRAGITTDNVKIRSKPSIDAASLRFQCQYPVEGNGAFVPKATTLRIIARTIKRSKVQNWNNYWYLVNVGLNSMVWMYGEFLKIE